MEGDYALLFPMRVEAITSGFLERPAAYKETMDLIWEAASLLPPIQDGLDAYENKLNEWKGRITSGG